MFVNDGVVDVVVDGVVLEVFVIFDAGFVVFLLLWMLSFCFSVCGLSAKVIIVATCNRSYVCMYLIHQ